MSASVPGVVLGTAAYRSPEQAKGKESDRTTDMWAFGCVLYEMLTSHAAFEGVNDLYKVAVQEKGMDYAWNGS
jgi:serine/threonine protein kinase